MNRFTCIAWGLVALACGAAEAAQPQAAFTATPTSGCAPLDVQFTNQSTGGEFLSYSWDFGDGKSSTAENPLHRYEVPAAYPAEYTVTLVVTDDAQGFTDTETKVNYIQLVPPPQAAFSASVSCGCGTPTAPLTVQFTDQSTGTGITSWAWKFGDGGTSDQENPSHQYTSPGAYTVELTVTDSCGSPDVATSQTPITVVDPPTVDFSGTPTTGCAPLDVDFTQAPAGEGITARLWEFGDGGTGDRATITHRYQNPGTYTVKLTLSKGCCSKTTTKAAYITVQAPPVVDFEADSVTGCPPHTVTFTNQSSNTVANLQWDFGDGGASTDENPTHVYQSSGQYTVTLSGVGPCGAVSKTRNNYISVGTPPVADFTPSVTSGCADLSVTFTDKSTGTGLTGWTWDFGDGSPLSTTRSPRHTYRTAGTFTVTLTVEGACGTSQKQAAVQVLAPVLAAFTATAPAGLTPSPPAGCGPLEVQFTDQSIGEAITSWAWDFGDGSTSAEQSPIHVYQPPALDPFKTYTVKLTVRNSCSSDTETKTGHVTVYALVVADFTATPVTGCAPVTVRFTDKSKGYAISSRTWDFGDGQTSTETSPFHVYQNAGTYTVTLTAQGLCGENVAAKSDLISVVTLPAAPASIEYEPIPAYLDETLTVRWPASAGAESYVVERTPVARVQWVKVCEVKVASEEPSYSCSVPLAQLGNFKFRVVAKNVCGSSPPLEGPPLEVLPPPFFAHWPLDDCKAEDVAKGHDGRFVGSVGCVGDRFGTKSSALQFRGTGHVSGDSLPLWTGDFSLSAWVKPRMAPEGSPPSDGIFLEIFPGAGAGQNAQAIRFVWSQTSSALAIAGADAQNPIAGFEDVAAEGWHFLMLSRSGATLLAYLDGVQATQPTDAFELGSNFVFGNSAAGDSRFLGDLDDVRYESRPRSAAEALALMIQQPGSLYLDPSLTPRPVTAQPGDSFEAMHLRFKTGTANTGGTPFQLDGLTLLVQDLPVEDGGAGASDGFYDYLEEVVLYRKSSCTAEQPDPDRLGTFRLASESPDGARFELVSEGPPATFANGVQVCLVVQAKIWSRAIPSDRIIRFVVKSPDDLEIVDAAGEAFIAGKRLVVGSGAEGNTITVMNFPPEIVGSVPTAQETQRAVGEVLGATLHKMELQAGATENVRLETITYRAVAKTTVEGITNAVLHVVTGPEPGQMEPIGTGVVDAKNKTIRFEGLQEEISSQGPTELILTADISVLPPEAGTAFVAPPAGGRQAFSPLAAGMALAGLQLLCILVFLQYARARQLCLRPARVVAFWLFSSLAVIAHGCGPAAIGVGVTAAVLSGGGGGGGSGGGLLFQVGILEKDDLSAHGTTTGVLAKVPDGTLPLVGPAYEVRKK